MDAAAGTADSHRVALAAKEQQMSFLKSVQKIPMSKVILWKPYIEGSSAKNKK